MDTITRLRPLLDASPVFDSVAYGVQSNDRQLFDVALEALRCAVETLLVRRWFLDASERRSRTDEMEALGAPISNVLKLVEVRADVADAIVARVHSSFGLERPIGLGAVLPIAAVIAAMRRACSFRKKNTSDDRGADTDAGITSEVAT